MVSRRNYFSIIIMMCILFFMFQFTQVIKERDTQYDINEFVVEEEKLPKANSIWSPQVDEASVKDGDFVLFFSDEDSELASVVMQWCTYTKRNMVQYETLDTYEVDSEKKPELVLIDADDIELGEDGELLLPILDLKVPVVFCGLPSPEILAVSSQLKEILGIERVKASETEVKGIYMFSGFLLGGEVLYQAKTDEEEKNQDMNLTVPWYITGSGTKTYMVGFLDDEELDNEDQPSLIWRNSYENTMVFAISNEYIQGLTGLGVLDALVYEMKPYCIYPIVNAQNVMVANFPNFSAENGAEIERLYIRSPQVVFRDVMWPSIAAMAESNNVNLTCFFNTQYDYLDDIWPSSENVEFYLKQLKELNSEAGISLKYKEGISFENVLIEDEVFYQSINNNYIYQAIYLSKEDIVNVQNSAGTVGFLEDIRTVACEYVEGEPIISYLNDGITLQYSTGNAKEHTFSDDLMVRSIQTALGYSNVLLDLHDAVWPQSVDDEWQNIYDLMSSNVTTYWSEGNGFSQTTLSQSDFRVRTLLSVDYEEERTGNTITLNVDMPTDEAWFLFRTHDEEIEEVRGGSYEQLEDNVYLICVKESIVEIDIKTVGLQ